MIDRTRPAGATMLDDCDMPGSGRFRYDPACRMASPEAPGLAALQAGIAAGQTIHARQSDPPVTCRQDSRQWLLCETSGSSGRPKTIRRSPESWTRSFDLTRDRFGAGPGDIYATLGALGHSLTLFATLEAFHLGADLLALGHLGPRQQAQRLARGRASVLYATPTQLGLLASGARAQGIADFPALRLVLTGGGTLAPLRRPALSALFPQAQLIEFFGASETSFITMADADTPPGSVGRAYPGVDLRIDADPGQPGELWLRSPYLFDGYASGASDQTRWQAGFLSIGEIGWLDASGHLFLKGRRSRMVTVADKNVFPEEIEALIAQVPAIEGCAVLALPDPQRGHALHCFVQTRDALPEAPLRRLCRETLGPEYVPRRFWFLPDLPLLPSGKPDLQGLRARIAGPA